MKSTRWEAPELLDGGRRASFAADIYGLACVAYQVRNILRTKQSFHIFSLYFQIFSGRVPFYECSDNMLDFNIRQGVRPSRPSPLECSQYGLTDEIWDIMMECWKTDPAMRPSATTIVSRLNSLSLPNRDSTREEARCLHNWDLYVISRVRSLLAANPFPLPAVDNLQTGPTAVQSTSFTRFRIPDIKDDNDTHNVESGRPSTLMDIPYYKGL